MEITEIIQYGIISEKSVSLQSLQPQQGAHRDRIIPRYTFRVHPEATKPQIKLAVEAMFPVKVVEVRTMRMPGKAKTIRTRKGQFSKEARPWKKAIVTLAEGQSIAELHP
ncbi:MAG: 50S ribosomal protein L23 [Ktedonobacterales bacterium]|nr:50S ribosomal protein L23 [Ktedonobacterales bacterium]